MAHATARLIRTLDELQRLAPAWESLSRGVPFREPTWLLTWWRHFGERRGDRPGAAELFVVAVEADGRLLGLAPWFVEPAPWQGRVVQMLGSGVVCSDYLTVLCGEGHEAAVAALVAAHLHGPARDEWDRIDFDGAATDDHALAALFAEMNRCGCEVERRPAPHCWRVALPSSWDAYLWDLSKSHRKQLRRLTKRVLDTPRAVWHTTTDVAQLADDWQVFVDLHQRRRASLGQPGCFADPQFALFHEEVAARLLLRGQLRLHRLELDGRPIAAEYHVAGEKAVFAYQSGLDPAALDEQPGHLAAIEIIRRAMREGFACYDLLRGDESYKAHWGATPIATENVTVVNARASSRLRYALRRRLRTVRDSFAPRLGTQTIDARPSVGAKPQATDFGIREVIPS
jgi:CelD/BcsL family acetyltransferase involved in cellulose biosynthesis